jgi:hypothetical protein
MENTQTTHLSWTKLGHCYGITYVYFTKGKALLLVGACNFLLIFNAHILE